MASKVGEIYYEVDAVTEKLLKGLAVADDSLDDLQKGFDKTDKAADKTSFQMKKTSAAIHSMGKEASSTADLMGSLKKVLAGYVTLSAAKGLIDLTEGYAAMSERVKMAVNSQEEYEHVQKRLLKTANTTYRSLAEAQEVFIGTSDNLRDLGYSLDQSIDISDSLSYAFVRNATASDRAAAAMRTYDVALNKGRLDQMGWLTIMGAVPTIAQDIGDAIGKTAQEVREMGVSGEVTAKMLNEGLLQSMESNKAAAEGMATTISDAFTNLTNNLSVFLGEMNEATGATGLAVDAIELFGNNINTVATALGIIGSAALSRHIALIGQSTIATMRNTMASRADALASLNKAKAEKAAAAAALASAQANLGLTATHTQLAAAKKADEAATIALTRAQAAYRTAGAGLLALLGGPVGIIAMVAGVAASFLLTRDSAKEASKSVDELTASYENLNKEQLNVRRNNIEKKIAEVTKDIQTQSQSLGGLEKDYKAIQTEYGKNYKPKGLENIKYSIDEAKAKQRELVEQLVTLQDAYTNVTNAINGTVVAQTNLNNAFDDSGGNEYIEKLRQRTNALEDGNSELKKAQRFLSEFDKSRADALKNGGLVEADMSPEIRKQILDEAKAYDELAASKLKAGRATKTLSDAEKAAKKAAEDLKRGNEENAKTIEGLVTQLALASLRGEDLAVAQANLSLNKYATTDQIEQVTKLAKALHEVNEQRKLEGKVGDDPLKYIRGDVQPLSGGEFDNQMARYEAEAQKEQERYAAQLVRLQEALDAKKLAQDEYHAEAERAEKMHSERMEQISLARDQMMITAAGDAFGALAGIIKSSAGEQNKAYQAMFAVSKAFAIANALLSLQTAIANAWKVPFPANIPLIGQAAASMGQVVSAVSSITMSGGRQFGGDVQGGSMYRVNEGGAPELLNSGGHQYLIPNARGEVVSNKNATQGGAAQTNVVINVTNNASANVQTEQSEGMDGETVINIVIDDIMGDGKTASVIQNKWGLNQQGR